MGMEIDDSFEHHVELEEGEMNTPEFLDDLKRRDAELERIRLAGEKIAREEEERAEGLEQLEIDGERIELAEEEEERRKNIVGEIEQTKTGFLGKVKNLFGSKKENPNKIAGAKKNFKGAPETKGGKITAEEEVWFAKPVVVPGELSAADIAEVEHIDEENWKPDQTKAAAPAPEAVQENEPVDLTKVMALSGSPREIRHELNALWDRFTEELTTPAKYNVGGGEKLPSLDEMKKIKKPVLTEAQKEERDIYRKLLKKGTEKFSTKETATFQAVEATHRFTNEEYEKMKTGELPWKMNAVWRAINEVDSGRFKMPATQNETQRPTGNGSIKTAVEAALGAGAIGGVAAVVHERGRESAKVEVNKEQIASDLRAEIDRLNAREKNIGSEMAALLDDSAILEAVNRIADPTERMAKLKSESVDQISEYYYDDPEMSNEQRKARFDRLLNGMDKETQAEFLNQQVEVVLAAIARQIDAKKAEEAAVANEIASVQVELAKYETAAGVEAKEKEIKVGDTVTVRRSDGTMEDGWVVLSFHKDMPGVPPELLNFVHVKKVDGDKMQTKNIDLNDLKSWQKKEPAEPTTETEAEKRARLLAEAKAAINAPTKGELPPEPDALTSYYDDAEPAKGERTPEAEAIAKAAIAKAENLFERWKQKILKNVSAYEGDMKRIIADLGDTSKPADIAERLVGAEYVSAADAQTLTPSELYRLKDELRKDVVFLLDVAAGRIENPLIGKEKERAERVEKAIAAEQDYLKPLLEDEAIHDSMESNLDTIATEHKTGTAADLEQSHYDLFATLPSDDARFEELADTIGMDAEARKSFAAKDKDRAIQLFSENWKTLIAKMKKTNNQGIRRQ
jgi:hypothetical protein